MGILALLGVVFEGVEGLANLFVHWLLNSSSLFSFVESELLLLWVLGLGKLGSLLELYGSSNGARLRSWVLIGEDVVPLGLHSLSQKVLVLHAKIIFSLLRFEESINRIMGPAPERSRDPGEMIRDIN